MPHPSWNAKGSDRRKVLLENDLYTMALRGSLEIDSVDQDKQAISIEFCGLLLLEGSFSPSPHMLSNGPKNHSKLLGHQPRVNGSARPRFVQEEVRSILRFYPLASGRGEMPHLTRCHSDRVRFDGRSQPERLSV